MFTQIGYISEFLIALVACVRAFAGVNPPHVYDKSVPSEKRSFTVVAFMWFLFSMHLAVIAKIIRCPEHLTTVQALESFRLAVSQLMSPQISAGCMRSAADVADERLLACMNFVVALKMRSLSKRFVANFTFERLFAGVCPQVSLQHCRSFESRVARSAFVRSLFAVNCLVNVQSRPMFERRITLVALKRFLSRMDAFVS